LNLIKKVLLKVMIMASSNRIIHFEEEKILKKLPDDHPNLTPNPTLIIINRKRV